jgi:hypothetical protein
MTQNRGEVDSLLLGVNTQVTGRPVRRRQVFFCPGYQPFGPKFYYKLFKRQVERYGNRFGFTAEVTNLRNDVDGVFSDWEMNLRNDRWSGETRYTLLNWDDLVGRYMRRTKIHTFLLKMFWDLDAIFSGTFWRLLRLNWRFGLTIAYPTFAVIGLLLGGLATAYGLQSVGHSLGTPVWTNWVVSALSAFGVFALGYYLLSRFCHLHLLLTSSVFGMQHARGRRLDYLERIDQFARRIVEAIHQSTEDEVLIVGHSQGSVCAIELMARALRLDPDLLETKTRVSLLTVGATLPSIGCNPCADSFRDDIAFVANQKQLFWLEYQATQDILSFHRFEPLRDLPGLPLDDQQMNPVVYSACFEQSFTPENYRKHRFNSFRLHFHYLMAVDRLVPCDYMMIIAGPATLELRGMDPQSAMVMCHGPDAWSATEDERHPLLPLPPARQGNCTSHSIANDRAAQGQAIKTASRKDASDFTSRMVRAVALILVFFMGVFAAEALSSVATKTTDESNKSRVNGPPDIEVFIFGERTNRLKSSPLHPPFNGEWMWMDDRFKRFADLS